VLFLSGDQSLVAHVTTAVVRTNLVPVRKPVPLRNRRRSGAIPLPAHGGPERHREGEPWQDGPSQWRGGAPRSRRVRSERGARPGGGQVVSLCRCGLGRRRAAVQRAEAHHRGHQPTHVAVTLRGLERDGIVTRTVYSAMRPTSPIASPRWVRPSGRRLRRSSSGRICICRDRGGPQRLRQRVRGDVEITVSGR